MTKTSVTFTLIFCSFFPSQILSSTNISPLSKITITSQQATCKKSNKQSGQFVFNYQKEVKVTLADESTVTSDSLEIFFNERAFSKKNRSKEKSRQKFKKVIFSGNVLFKNKNLSARSDNAQLFLDNQTCILTGRVTINQKKTTDKDIPITVESDRAEINLSTSELCFTGTVGKPVSTVIELDSKKLNKKT